jgi:hypothetical protein
MLRFPAASGFAQKSKAIVMHDRQSDPDGGLKARRTPSLYSTRVVSVVRQPGGSREGGSPLEGATLGGRQVGGGHDDPVDPAQSGVGKDAQTTRGF